MAFSARERTLIMPNTSTIVTVYQECVDAIRSGKLIQRVSDRDKEFHFQNWVQARIVATGLNYEVGGRNSYPDFRMVHMTEGYEVKGLAYPGRHSNYDSNSQAPSGFHNGRTIYYVFGRYPKKPDGNTYPVLDLVVCHGDFLNADHNYVHENKSFKGFGSYGDIMIRDRKMYVVPTPFGIAKGLSHTQTLILPADVELPDNFEEIGSLIRKESKNIVVTYTFDLRSNLLTMETILNPSAGKEHHFKAWRLKGTPGEKVEVRTHDEILAEIEADIEEDAENEN